MDSLLFRDDIAEAYREYDRILDGRNPAEIALSEETIDSSGLPVRYRKAMKSFLVEYRRPEIQRELKEQCQKRARRLQLEKGISTSEICRSLELNVGNVNRFLKDGNVDVVTLEAAQGVVRYLRGVSGESLGATALNQAMRRNM